MYVSSGLIIQWAGYIAGLGLYFHLRKRWMRTPALTLKQGLWLGVGMAAGSLAGGLLLRLAEASPGLWRQYGEMSVLPGAGAGGHVGLAAMLGGWIGVELAKRFLRIAHPSGDVFVFPMILGLGISRLGRFFDAGGTCLYEAGVLAILAGVFLWRIRTHRQRGCMFSQFVFAYLALCFLVEFLRPRYALSVVPLSAVQFTALAGMAHALWHWKDECCNVAMPHIATNREAATGPEFVELTNSLCPQCLRKIEAKVLIEGGGVFLQKFCPDHGLQRVLIADDVAYWRQSRSLYKPPTSPLRRNTAMKQGCPHDCGLCPDHEQHSCLAIVEVTEQCDLGCPICYAACTPAHAHRSLEQIEFMLDAAVANEGRVNVVQISGGEPTLHPELFAILDAVRRRPIRHIMLNSNGRRIAEDAEFVRRLADYMPGFEVYLQFDSLRPETLRQLRGTDLSAMRLRAIDALEKHGISTTLVATLKKGVNEGEVGEILDFALSRRCVRGVTFQPIQAAGRLGQFDPAAHRLTLTEVRKAILQQHKLFSSQDLVPVPCHTDALAMAYAIRLGGKMVPLSKMVDPRSLLNLGGNTICYEQEPNLRQHVMQLFSASASPLSAAASLSEICCAPGLLKDGAIRYENVFRLIIMQFMDAWSMDLRSIKRSCVHIVHPDGRLIPFETYNLFHR